MRHRVIGFFSLGLFLTFLSAIAVVTCSCDQTPSSPPGGGSTPTPSTSIVVTNNTSYAVSMGMDGASLVSIPISGGSYTFKSALAGTHTFAGTSTYNFLVNGTSYCRGVTASCVSSSLSLSQNYAIVITANTSDTFCFGIWDIGSPGPDWSCP